MQKLARKSKSSAVVSSRESLEDADSSDDINRDARAPMFADQQSSVQFEQIHMPEARLATNGDEQT